MKMARYALKGTFDETGSDEDSNVTDTELKHSIDSSPLNECLTDESGVEDSILETDEENLDQAPSYVSQSYSKTHQSDARWKSLRRS
ncbi:unnamed protein product [Rotaria sordida]|uniref:Uncharacterized protein n=1 Tax=Rotaria sordida TaxID=392033 RepID=A0A815VHH7_9BILA|nr:unnamed protein product [Rotaria sordida]CAF4287142.1 unnamed protein product [Rotaria sordida]